MVERARDERRKQDRRPKKFLVKFRVTGGGMPRDIYDRVGQVCNLSRSGLLLRSRPELPIGTLLELSFPENIFGGAPVTLNGAVRRLDAHSETGERALGVMFVKVGTAAPARPAQARLAPAPGTAVPASGPAAPGSERRASSRASQKLLLKLQCVSSGLFQEFNPRGGFLVNLSDGGIAVTTNRDYAPGSVLEVSLPENPLGPARKVRAKVVWTRSAEKPGHFSLGLNALR